MTAGKSDIMKVQYFPSFFDFVFSLNRRYTVAFEGKIIINFVSIVVGYYAASLGDWYPTFRNRIVFPFSKIECKISIVHPQKNRGLNCTNKSA